ncbi:hypothetical protein PG984_008219 [Apiospora sp. TS-2023a]
MPDLASATFNAEYMLILAWALVNVDWYLKQEFRLVFPSAQHLSNLLKLANVAFASPLSIVMHTAVLVHT